MNKEEEQDIEQIQMYVNYYDREIKSENENRKLCKFLSLFVQLPNRRF